MEDGTRIEYASRDLRALCHVLMEIFSIIGYRYPPFFSHLMDLLITPPGDYDTDPQVRCRFLLAVRNNVAFASPARLFALLVNFAQLCCCIPPDAKTKLEEVADTMPRFFDPLNKEFRRFTLHYDWTQVGMESNLLQTLTELKKLKEKKGESKNPQVPKEGWSSPYLFPSLVYQMRIFFIHGPEVMMDDNGNMVLDDFMELIYIIDYLLEDALPNVVEYILHSLHVHALVRSCGMFTTVADQAAMWKGDYWYQHSSVSDGFHCCPASATGAVLAAMSIDRPTRHLTCGGCPRYWLSTS